MFQNMLRRNRSTFHVGPIIIAGMAMAAAFGWISLGNEAAKHGTKPTASAPAAPTQTMEDCLGVTSRSGGDLNKCGALPRRGRQA